MAEPLDYRNDRVPQMPDGLLEQSRVPAPRTAIPAEFDTLLTRTSDLAAAAAIEKFLSQENIPFYRADDGRAFDRVVELFIHAKDQPRAGEMAAGLFLRRKKFKSYARPEMPQMTHSRVFTNLPRFPGEW